MKSEYRNCNICNTDRVRSFGKRQSPDGDASLETDVVQCASCGLMYPNPMPVVSGNEMQNNFKDAEEYFSGPVADKRIKKCEKTIKMIEKIKSGKGNLLDIGCGRGELAYAAGRQNWRVTATEILKAFAEYARGKFNISVLLGEINDLELPEGNFDVVCLNSVIQYVQNPLLTLKKICSLLKKDGILYIEVTNEDAAIFKISDLFKNIWAKRRTATHLSPLFPSFQVYGFNRKSLSKALKEAGLRVYDMKTKGTSGGGRVKGKGLKNRIINFVRKIIIFIGGITGNGHLIYCIAKRGGGNDSYSKT